MVEAFEVHVHWDEVGKDEANDGSVEADHGCHVQAENLYE